MITSSLVLYKTKVEDINTIIGCTLASKIDKLYVIDNSPTDALREIIEGFRSPKIEYIYGQGNVGYGSANNIGLKKALEQNAKYHVILNPDIFFEENVIEELETFMDSHPKAGYIIPKTLKIDGTAGSVCKRMPTPLAIFAVRLLPSTINKRISDRYNMLDVDGNCVRVVPILSGCFMFLRMDTIRKVGLFDERFFMYFEDFDLMRRIGQVAQNVYYPKLSIIHNHGNEHRKSKTMFKIAMKSAITYFNKWGWLFDSERRRINKHAADDSNIIED